MAMTQIVWSLDDKTPLMASSLMSEKELEDLLYEHIEILNESWLVIGRQVRTVSGKYIDLLCMDHDGDMVVVELKKDLTPREVTAQTIDYASCVAKLSAEDIAKIYLETSNQQETLNEAYDKKFHRQLDEETVNTKVKMVVVAAQMDDSTERIISYLRDTYSVDINILFFNVFEHSGERLISRVWFEDDVEETPSITKSQGKWNGEYYDTVKTAKDVVFSVNGEQKSFEQIDVRKDYLLNADDLEKAEYVVKVNWIKTVASNAAIKELGFFGNQNTVCRPVAEKWNFTVERLKKIWNIE